MEEHKEHLSIVNRKKCVFGQDRVDYLGHIAIGRGVMADPFKITAMVEWPVPRTIRELCGFLGLTGYYRKFLEGYGKKEKSLTDLLKNDKFCWSDEAMKTFEKLKQEMTQVPVLTLPDFSKSFVVETDASGYIIEAILMHEE